MRVGQKRSPEVVQAFRPAYVGFSAVFFIFMSTVGAMQLGTGEGSYEYDGRSLTAEQKLGRDTWYLWTAGNQKFWRRMGVTTSGKGLVT